MIAECQLSCGRWVLFVGEIAVAMEGDRCRHVLPEEVAEPIPDEEWHHAKIGGKSIKSLPFDVIQFFRGDNWTEQSLKWAADQINNSIAKQNHLI